MFHAPPPLGERGAAGVPSKTELVIGATGRCPGGFLSPPSVDARRVPALARVVQQVVRRAIVRSIE